MQMQLIAVVQWTDLQWVLLLMQATTLEQAASWYPNR